MLGKLIKHEFRATGRIMLPLLGALMLLSPLAGACMRLLDADKLVSIFRFFGALIVGVFYAGAAVICAVALVLMLRRFYSNLLCNEGYLMFTLPVSVNQLIISKLIVSFVWFVVSFAASCIFIVIAACAGSDFSADFAFVSEITRVVGAGNIIAYIFEGMICLFLFSSYVCLHFYAAMALGHSFSNHKMLLSVCFFILLSFLLSWFFVAVLQLVNSDLLASVGSSFAAWMDKVKAEQNYALIPHFLFLCAALYFFALSAICYIAAYIPLKKHLNIN